jgi:hypothetical protein
MCSKAVLWIRDILVRIRILLFFFSGFQDVNKKQVFFCFLLFEGIGTFTAVFKDKKS